MWSQHWPITEPRGKERDARKIVAENGGKHPFGLTSLTYLLRDKGGKGLHSIEREYKETKFGLAVQFLQNRDPVMKMVRDFVKRGESVGHPVTDKVSDELRVTEEGEVAPAEKLKFTLGNSKN